LRAVGPPEGFELFGPPSLAVPVEALLPEGDGLVVEPTVEPDPLVPDAVEPGTFDGLRLFGPPSLAVPVEALLPDGVFTPAAPALSLAMPLVRVDGLRLFGPPSLAVPVEALLPEALPIVLPLRVPADDDMLPIELAVACTPSESRVC
jgi:hypothetical protein